MSSGFSIPAPVLAASATVTRVSASATSITLLSSNEERRGAVFYNDSTSICYLKFGTTASSSSFTVRLTGQSEFVLDSCPIYTGRIDAIWALASGAMQVTELTI